MAIHPTAIIAPSAEISPDCEIGPYCIIGEKVILKEGTRLHSHVVIEQNTTLGSDCECFPFAAIGGRTQDLKFKGEETFLEIGDKNTFRENTTIHRATVPDRPTIIGSNNYFLAYSHVAHDCIVGNHTIFSNNATIAGHVIVEDYAIISGLSAIHQFCRVGRNSMTAGLARCVKDIPPYMIVDGATRGINLVGLKRHGFSEEDITALKVAFKKIFLKKDLNLGEQIKIVKDLPEASNEHVQHLLSFIEESERGITR